MEIRVVENLPRYKRPLFTLPEHWGEKMNFVVFGTKWNCREIDIIISAILTAIARKGVWAGVSVEEVAKVLKDNDNYLVPHDSDWFRYLVKMSTTRDVVLIKNNNSIYIFPTFVLKRTLRQSKATRLMSIEDGQG